MTLMALALATPAAAASLKSIMGAMGETTKAAKAMLASFDQAKAQAILEAYAKDGAAADALFVPGRDPKARDLHNRFLAFAASVETAKTRTADRAGFRAGFTAIASECRSCHTAYK